MPLFSDQDITYIPNPDPEWHYLWCPIKPDVLIDYIQSGYEMVVKPEEVSALYGGDDVARTILSATGRVQRGDMILLKMPLPKWKEIEAFQARQAADRMEAGKQDFHARIEKIGSKHITSFEMPVEEHFDRKEHATREGRPRVGYTGKGAR